VGGAGGGGWGVYPLLAGVRAAALRRRQPRHPLPPGAFFFTIVTGPRRSLSLKLSDTRVFEPQIRARLVATTYFCVVVVLKLRATPISSDRCSGSEEGAYLKLNFFCIDEL